MISGEEQPGLYIQYLISSTTRKGLLNGGERRLYESTPERPAEATAIDSNLTGNNIAILLDIGLVSIVNPTS